MLEKTKVHHWKWFLSNITNTGNNSLCVIIQQMGFQIKEDCSKQCRLKTAPNNANYILLKTMRIADRLCFFFLISSYHIFWTFTQWLCVCIQFLLDFHTMSELRVGTRTIDPDIRLRLGLKTGVGPDIWQQLCPFLPDTSVHKVATKISHMQ